MSYSIQRTTQRKKGKEWETTAYYAGVELYRNLASELAAKHIGHASYIKSIKRKNRYDGTQEYTVTYDNGCRNVYLVENFY